MPKINLSVIPADDPERAIAFYRGAFGWKFDVAWEYQTPNGRERTWNIRMEGDAIDGGLTRREYPGQPIQVGITVPSVADYLTRIQEHGGSIVVPRTPLPAAGIFAVCKDTEGNTFIVFERDANAR